jgi:hypothetical protein
MEDIALAESFSIMREAWVPGSVPEGYRWQDDRRVWWYVKDREVREEDIFPYAESKPGESYIPVLEINFREARYPGQGYDADDHWSGLMTMIGAAGRDCSDLSHLEVWLRRKQGAGGSMHVDLGEISENFYNPWTDSLHTEDRDRDGKLDHATENTGLDGVFTHEPGDDPYDDWYYSEGDFSRINGTEGNPNPHPDTEDLDGDGYLDTQETFFRLSFDLDDPTYVANQSREDWTLYRIPLMEAETHGGIPSWDAIRYVRIFFSETDSPAIYQIAFLELTGNTWVNEGVREYGDMSFDLYAEEEESFWISAKNTRDDPDYDPPYDPGKDSQGFRNREQSMALNLNLHYDGHCGVAHRALDREEDLGTYETLSFYCHGDSAASRLHVYAFVRLGADSLNFYEYTARVWPGWQSLEVGLDDLSALEDEPPISARVYGHPVDLRWARTGTGWISMRGEPTFERIAWIGAGVALMEDVPGGVSLEFWLDDYRAVGTW